MGFDFSAIKKLVALAKAQTKEAVIRAKAGATAKAKAEGANKVEEYIVNTQKEDNAGNPDITSLREAITAANKSYAGKVFINFQMAGDNKSSWHIKPEKPLPALLHTNTYINHSLPKNVTIDGSDLPRSKDGARTYSLLTIGNYENVSSNDSSKPVG